ncbi:substrate-binding domain-containing protein [Streptomyces endophyticus]|uniref:ABC transporter substrate-binding protein n=1 Tax=Streptomyces endophyticus TaxID=714166 RepID=A0ABU6F2P9_9ACTN|nr:hypothetical protein [Streptomyces endophyticus]MEB8338276.1 hypothetical protein [Streptomyces endophyticus]
MTRLSVALRRYPHTEPLLDGTLKVPGCELDLPQVEPIHRAFAPMVRELRYDVSELALATLLQAVEADVPVAALPVVLHGNFHHRSISVWGGEGRLSPEDLRGRRVGVRAYSQTTGLWVRGVLSDTYGVRAQDVTWVTREGAHVDGAPEPSNVERTSRPLVDALRDKDIAAVVMGARSADHVEGLVPVITDWKARQAQFLDTHGWVPINHLAVVRKELLETQPDLVRAVYRGLCAGIDAARPSEPTGTTRELVVQHGVTDTLLATLRTAIRYAREQELIKADLDAEDLFADFHRYVGGA